MRDRNLRYIFGLLSILLLVGLVYKLTKLPGGLILPGYILGGMVLIGFLIIALILTGLLKVILKSSSFSTLLAIMTSIAFTILHYIWYSPTLKIVIPNNYTGQVTLVVSNVDKNILTVDSNGIGYITRWTFDKTYSAPIVIDKDGQEMNHLCVGFNQLTFWANGTAISSKFKDEIKFLSFYINPKDTTGLKQNHTDFTNYLDKSKLTNKE